MQLGECGSKSPSWNSAQPDIDALLAVQPEWLADAYSTYLRHVTADSPAYPCHFGVNGHREGNNWFTSIDQSAAVPGHGADGLAAALRAFRKQAWSGPERQTLLAFVGPPDPEPDLGRDYRRFWDLLASLTLFDERPWPHDRPVDAADPRWEWCFDGEPWFVFGCSPAYRLRRSRNLGPCLTLVFQVRRVFARLSGSTPAGQAAKWQIRRSLLAYDAVAPHPHLGDDQHSSVYKWRQYMLPDDQHVRDPAECPFPAVVARQAGAREASAAAVLPDTGTDTGFRFRMSSLLRAAANDLKRDDAAADAELGLPPGTFAALARSEKPLSMELVSRICSTWPLNERDLLPLNDDCPDGVLIYRHADSLASARVLARGGRPYYEYRDTAMSRLASYRPEWIRMLQLVDDNDPDNPGVQWNEGHLLYQFTYFVGPVNYYYSWQGEAYCTPMNTGDSVWGIPFAPHSFTARSGAAPAFILALTYGGDLLGDAQRELAVLGPRAARQLALPVGPAASAQAALLRAYMQARMMTQTRLCEAAKIPADRIARLCAGEEPAREDEVRALARALGVSRRDLTAAETQVERGVRIQHHAQAASWQFPDRGSRAYQVTRLAADPLHPHTTALELQVLTPEFRDDSVLDTYQHQHLYVLGDAPLELRWQHSGRSSTAVLTPGDSAYVRPRVPLVFRRTKTAGDGSETSSDGMASVLLLRIGGAAGTDARFALSAMAEGGIDRYLAEDRMWYRVRGRTGEGKGS